jgi:hypothetical protein
MGSTWWWHITGVPARVLTAGHNAAVSSTFKMDVEELASSRASRTRRLFPSSSNYPNVSSGAIAGDHPVGVMPPFAVEIARRQVIALLTRL